MPRRFETGRVFHATAQDVSVARAVVEPQTNIILEPKLAVISAGASAFEFNLLDGSGIFLHGHLLANTSIPVKFPDGLELTKDSGIFLQAIANTGSVTLYYCSIDESPGITKVASRAASYQASLGAKAVRNPSVRAVGDES